MMRETFATDVSPIVVDIETAGLPNAADFLEPVQPAKNLKDPEKIAADIVARTEERNQKLALDWNVGRIVAVGWKTQTASHVGLCADEDEEGAELELFWDMARNRSIVGFNVRGFDLKFMVQRSRYLDIAYPRLDLGRYSKGGVIDLFSELTFGDSIYDQGAMRRTLHAFCRRFGIPVTDTTTGKDIAALVAAGDWAGISAHVTSDVELTVALAQRLGVIQSQPALETAASF